METDSWAAVVLLAAAVALFAVATAAEAAVISSLRTRPGPSTARGASPGQALAADLQEGRAAYSSLALARHLALIASTAIVAYLLLKEAGLNWTVLTVTILAALGGFVVVQAAARAAVAADPHRWLARLGCFVASVRFLRRPAAFLNVPRRTLLGAQRLAGARQEPPATTEELLRLMDREEGADLIGEKERQMIRGIVGLEETTVREIMVPRIDIVALPSDSSFEEIARTIVERGHSRIPLFENTIDNIVGVVYAREVLGYLANGARPVDIKAMTRPPYFVPESKKASELLAEMRQHKLSIAIVVDEYGGTAGLVTIEDLIEEIVGEIADEFDTEEETIHRVSETEALLDARVSIDALQELFGVQVEQGDFDTVGGFVFNYLGKMPSVGEEIEVDGLIVRVVSVSGRRIKRVRVIKEEPPPPGNGGNGPK